MLGDRNQGINVVHYVKFTSSGMGKVALVVAVILEQNHEMHRPEGNSLTFN